MYPTCALPPTHAVKGALDHRTCLQHQACVLMKGGFVINANYVRPFYLQAGQADREAGRWAGRAGQAGRQAGV